MAKRRKSSVEDALISGLKAAMLSEQRALAEKQASDYLFQREREQQIKEFKKNIRGAKVWKG